ncbi:xenotropic and polytropic retrovirus receptor 1 [Anaeramoeba ignava]|uniref:Xenotropic and polytropic retrovirus receptor 1 n=1 Tax=Anaeramoeba ignava TaxID=1746090 RepID=A0A9Q0LCD6_ANAIG|nr:xenotropic and polytropic retrovirus receptor 1 [Anaeramoeba ignava]
MKFGKFLRLNKVSEWESHYINYKQLKKIIKQIKLNKQEEEQFWKQFKAMIDKVNNYYLILEKELIGSFPLAQKFSEKEVFVVKGNDPPARFRKPAYRVEIETFFLDLQKLKQYADLNYLACAKILKKFKKNTHKTTGDNFLQSHVSQLPFHSSQNLQKLYKNGLVVFSHVFTEKNLEIAKETIEDIISKYRFDLTRISKSTESGFAAISLWDQLDRTVKRRNSLKKMKENEQANQK